MFLATAALGISDPSTTSHGSLVTFLYIGQVGSECGSQKDLLFVLTFISFPKGAGKKAVHCKIYVNRKHTLSCR